MTATERRKLALVRDGELAPEVGLWLAALHDTRQRMREVLTKLPDELIDRVPPDGGSSIGTLLYHIALIETDWLLFDILGRPESEWPRDLFPVDHRLADATLSPFTGDTLEQHLARLKTVRTMLVDAVRTMSADQLHELRPRDDYDVSAAWVLHHLMQHEAEHRSQIGSVRESLERQREPTG